ncbi:MAG: hypothetical protein LQ349_007554 [Xanthoria aureola]|nr:MAG: hypothetical protein LQ349_007554 [Xanthoria aureola]
MANLLDLADQWLRLDKEPATRAEIQSLLAQKNLDELEHRLSTRLTFGTAGLRAQMGAGFARLNSLTIIQTSQGLAEYLLSVLPNAAAHGIVVGHDARHNSQHFADLAAAVFESKGIVVWWYEDIVHTPLVPFAVRTLRAAAGIMITASHNPARDNGYKVYGSNGCQINSPEDTGIATSILLNLEPQTWTSQASSLRRPVLTAMRSQYMHCLGQLPHLPEAGAPSIRFVYTPMHGVGLRYMIPAVEMIGMKSGMTIVDQQGQPNPDFPTVNYPNPEEKGALDLAISTAEEKSINLIIANDPDADRFAVAEKIADGWHQFTGDQVGVLLAHWMFSSMSSQLTTDDIMLTTAVSSQMLACMAEAEGFSVRETLTGFKWLGNVAQGLKEQGKRVHFAYEEALGYMFPSVVSDKDGITASVMFLSACSKWGSPWTQLQKLYGKYGYFETANTYWRSPNIQKTQSVFEAVRNIEQPFPSHVGHRKVVRWRDLTTGYDSATETYVPDLPTSANTQMLTCWLDGSDSDDGIRFTVRASGTEPKIKIYLECRSKHQKSAHAGAVEALQYLRETWFRDPSLKMEDRSTDA